MTLSSDTAADVVVDVVVVVVVVGGGGGVDGVGGGEGVGFSFWGDIKVVDSGALSLWRRLGSSYG